MHIADSFLCRAETNIVKQLCSNKNFKKRKQGSLLRDEGKVEPELEIAKAGPTEEESGYFLTETKAAAREPSTENCIVRAGTTSDNSKSNMQQNVPCHEKDKHMPLWVQRTGNRFTTVNIQAGACQME